MENSAKKREILLFPCNGNAIEAIDAIESTGLFIPLGFIDDQKEKQKKKILGLNIFSRKALDDFPEALVLAVPGSPSTFRERAKQISGLNIPRERFARVIHANASVSAYASVGTNVLLMAGVVITAGAQIGDHVCVLPNSVIHHDSEIGDYSLIGANVVVAGYTKVGRNCYIGSGSNIINNCSVGDRALVGIGTNVVKSVASDKCVVGNPAREILNRG